MSDVMIQVENLTKDYGPTRAVDKVTFNVRKGEVLGFLGPNGAGKSTTMKMLTCFLSPTAGTAKVAGFDVFEESLEVRRRIGYLPEDTPIYRDMTVLEYLQFAAEMRGMDLQKSPVRIKEIGGRCGLGDVAGKLVGELSKGFRQRLGLAQAMLHDPDILILDEPTSGLDPNQIVEIRSLIKEIGKERTVILSTHILPEVQATCSRILIISGGKLVADGTPEALRAREKRGRYRLVIHAGGGPAFRTPEASQEAIRASLAKLAGVGGCEAIAGEDGAFSYGIDAASLDDLRPLLFKSAVDNRWTLLELVRESVSLEDVFRNLTTGDEPKHPIGDEPKHSSGDQPKHPIGDEPKHSKEAQS
jgi:ABC-2 type transport system ATP-binding protein